MVTSNIIRPALLRSFAVSRGPARSITSLASRSSVFPNSTRTNQSILKLSNLPLRKYSHLDQRRAQYSSDSSSSSSTSRSTTPSSAAPKPYTFPDIQAHTQNPGANPDRVLIDVREPHEYADGFIPTAHNMPLKSQPDGIFLPPEEFEERFGFAKPDLRNNEVVFYCRSGVRSQAASQLAEQAGYEQVGDYSGSWLDWQKNTSGGQ